MSQSEPESSSEQGPDKSAWAWLFKSWVIFYLVPGVIGLTVSMYALEQKNRQQQENLASQMNPTPKQVERDVRGDKASDSELPRTVTSSPKELGNGERERQPEAQSGLRDTKTVKEEGEQIQGGQKREGETPRPKEVKIEARFTAKVGWIEMDGEREVEVVPVGFDAHWLVGIEILSVEQPIKPFDKKEKSVLLIHSPARLFGGEADEAPGKTYSFKVAGEMKDGHPEFYSAEAEQNASPEKRP